MIKRAFQRHISCNLRRQIVRCLSRLQTMWSIKQGCDLHRLLNVEIIVMTARTSRYESHILRRVSDGIYLIISF